jgi:hypothetical protein
MCRLFFFSQEGERGEEGYEDFCVRREGGRGSPSPNSAEKQSAELTGSGFKIIRVIKGRREERRGEERRGEERSGILLP